MTVGEPVQSSGGRLRRLWHRVATAVEWTPPTSTEIGTVAKSALAAGLSWALAVTWTDAGTAVLAALTAIVVVQVNVRASVGKALQRTAAVVLGVLAAVAIGDALSLNGFTVGLLVGVALGLAQLVLRLPPAAARQVPISVLVVLTTVSADPGDTGWRRAGETVLGAAVGIVVSLVLPASRLVDARQTVQRLGAGISDVLLAMDAGLQEPWSTEQTEAWRRTSHAVRDRLVAQANEAVGNSREFAKWNVRDRRHRDELGRYEDFVPCLHRSAIGVWAIARGLDDHARIAGQTHRSMPALGTLLGGLAAAVDEFVRYVLGASTDADVVRALDEVRVRRARSMQAAARRARVALEHDDDTDRHEIESEWLGYVALLVQVDRIASDLRAQLPPAAE
jgi:Fusaric acid resistance protein-like